MKAPLPDSAHATDEVVARINPSRQPGKGARGGRAAFIGPGTAAAADGPRTVPAGVVRQGEAALPGGVPDGV